MTNPPVAQADAARALAADLKRGWRKGEPADAAAALAAHPELARHKSVVVDLAYEEFLLREQAGAAPSPGSFAERFPAFRASIRSMLDAHRLLVEQPELLDPAAGDWPEAGSRFEGLDLLADLGRGAFGHAYLAFDPGTDRLCVLKLATGRSAEAKVIGRLAHPHVTDVYWARAVGTRTAVCMPFVGVSTLADVVSTAFPRPGDPAPPTADVILRAAETDMLAGQADRRSAPVVRPGEAYLVGACAVAARIADAVAYLHREGVAHGDLKPSNVVVGPGGAPHLIDFNLSTGGDAPAAVRGTPAYMAPELLDAAAAKTGAAAIDPARADLFSLGVVVFELLTGRLPFPPQTGGGSFAALAAAVRAGTPAMPAGLPGAAAAILAACLDPDPARRPASAGELAAALDRFVRGRRTRRRRVAAVLAVLALVAVGVPVGIRLWPQPAGSTVPEVPPPRPDLMTRGRKALRAGDLAMARADFFDAHKQTGDAKALALAGYCLALAGQTTPAVGVVQQAIREGADSAEVYNTLGYALAQAGRIPQAGAAIDEAVKRDRTLPAVRYNRAIALFQVGFGAPAGVDPRAAEDIRVVLDAGLSSPNLHFDAARIFAACSARDPALKAAAVEQVRAAIRAGGDPATGQRDMFLRLHLGATPDFGAALATARGTPPARPPQLRLVEPYR